MDLHLQYQLLKPMRCVPFALVRLASADLLALLFKKLMNLETNGSPPSPAMIYSVLHHDQRDSSNGAHVVRAYL